MYIELVTTTGRHVLEKVSPHLLPPVNPRNALLFALQIEIFGMLPEKFGMLPRINQTSVIIVFVPISEWIAVEILSTLCKPVRNIEVG